MLRNDRSSDSRTFLPGFYGHFTRHFLNKEVKFLHIRGNIFPKNRTVQRIGFQIELDTIRNNVWV